MSGPAPRLPPPVEDPGFQQVMTRCDGCARRVRVRTRIETVIALTRAIPAGVLNPELPLLSYQCKCSAVTVITLRALGLA